MPIKEIPDDEPLVPDDKLGITQKLRRAVFGTPVASQGEDETLLRKLLALPIFCSDGISSVAYGNQQILLALCASGLWTQQHAAAYGQYAMMISFIIFGLIVVVAASYWQTIYAYPNGGGSYIVAKDNLGDNPGLLAAAALLIDYTLTVSVSVASGLQNLESVPLLAGFHIEHHMVAYCIIAIVALTFANLRGLKESGTLFAVPVYTFIVMCYVLIFVGVCGPFLGWAPHLKFANQTVPYDTGAGSAAISAFSILVLLRAFANGCSAMTGIEAVSNGIPAFKEPKSKNAAIVLISMAAILGSIFLGVSWLTTHFHIVYWEHEGLTSPAVIDQLSGTIFGKEGPGSVLYLLMQASTSLILIIAAQTSFAGFPRLASILARDGYMPRQFMHVGDRLAFNNGIIILGIFSSALIVLKKGSVDLLIPFFAIGVFVAFTLSQSGMVVHWFKEKSAGWQRKSIINGVGAICSFVVVIDIAAEKFFEGAWFVIVVIGVLLFMFKRISKHYRRMAQLLDPLDYRPEDKLVGNTVIVLIQGVHAGTLAAIDYARSISKDYIAVWVAIQPERLSAIEVLWDQYVPDVELVVLDSPYRSLVSIIAKYLDTVHAEKPNHRITVVIPEYVTSEWWQGLLHGNTGLLLKLALLNRRDVVVANVRYWLKGS